MNRQRAQQAQQNAAPQQRNALLRHAAVHPVAEQELSFNESATGLEHDFSQLPASPATAPLGQPASNASCSVSPQRCPFGGACHSCPPHIQAKLKIGQPGDKYEQEADRVAEQVMRMPEPQVQRKEGCSSCEGKEDEEDKLIQAKPLFGQITPLPSSVQRKTEQEAEKDEDEDKILQAKSTGRTWNAHAHADHPLIRNALSSPGQPLDAATRSFMEPRFGQDFSGVRVHTDGKAAESARAVNARAYTVGRDVVFGAGQYAPGSSEGRRLVAHELTHVGQQKGTSNLIQRLENTSEDQIDEFAEEDGRNQTFSFSEEEMESRLSSTPTEGAATGASPAGEIEGTESGVEGIENEKETDETIPEEETEVEVKSKERESQGGRERNRRGGHARGKVSAHSIAGGANAPETPGPASEFEGLVSQNVADYLEGNLSEEQRSQFDPRTLELLEAVDMLGERSLTDPEAAALQGLTGEGLQAGASKTGYEGEPLWLRTLASVRDVTGQLGGIVGIIGLVATVSGFILSLLIPPVGAFLLTVGRFCDIAALILDAISLVLGVILTGYNLYRLKNETNPEERRRLLGMVRQDAMGTVMSAVAVATAVAPGAARIIGKSKAGRFAGRALRSGGKRIAGAATRLAAQPTRLGRAAAGVGRVGAATVGGVRRIGTGVSGRFHTFFGRARDFGLRRALGTTMPGRAIRQIGSTTIGRSIGGGVGYVGRGIRAIGRGTTASLGYARRGMQWLAQSRLGRWVGDSRLGRYANRVYGENLDLARLLFARSERAHHTYVGGRLRAELAEVQRGGALNAAAARPVLQARLGQNFPEVNLADLHVRTNSISGNLEFVRPGTRGSRPLAAGGQRLQPFLDTMRRDEATVINNMITANPNITDAVIVQQLNARPNAPARWTEAEVWSFRQQASTAAVLKTPHHTISVLDAPHLAYDPRYIQLANAPLVTPRGTTQATSPWAQFGTRAARRPPPGMAAGQLDIPFVRRTSNAEDFARGMTTFRDGRVLTPPPGGAWDPAYFRSEDFFENLRRQGNTGMWINPHDPSQSLLFDAHFVAGHRWQTGEAGARAIFGPTVDFARHFEGTVGRTLLDRSLTTYGRSRVRYGEDWRGYGQRTEDSMLNLLGLVPDSLEGSDAVASRSVDDPSALEPNELMQEAYADMSMGTEMPSFMAADPESTGPFGYDAMLKDTDLPLFMMSEETLGKGGGEPDVPPSPVLYSSQRLASVREQRIAMAEAIGVVNEYITDAQQSENDNYLARGAAEELKQRNIEQGEFTRGECETVTAEQSNLSQASSAQENMLTENARASSESDRGKSEADTVQSEGQNVSVEPKPEEPESRSWLERAWDATAGALWDNLIAPAVRAVRRKVNQVMQSINEFIMNMINQALGLDEIEAELNSGGQDIQDRETSLTETYTGLQETQDQAAQEEERNRQSIEQADVNIADSQSMQEEAQALLNDLNVHDEMLQEEETTGHAYIVDFESRYQPFFEQQEQESGSEILSEPSLEPEEMSEENVV